MKVDEICNSTSLSQFSDLGNDLEESATVEIAVLSFSEMWPVANRETALAIEQSISTGNGPKAIKGIWTELKRLLAIAGQGVPGESAKDVAALLGIDGRSYLEIANLAHQVETSKKAIPHKTVLKAYLLLVQAVSLAEND